MTRSERDHVLVGLIGAGIGRSLSPLLHQREADRRGIRLIYTTIDSQRWPLDAVELPTLLRWARVLGYRGFNVTHPFKQAIVKHLDELAPEARAVGAVNTVVFDGGRARGHNTDGSGFRRGFEREFASVPRRQVVQLGAGGAGSAVAYALLGLGAGHLAVVDVDTARAQQLARALAAEFGPDRVSAAAPGDLGSLLAAAQGLVNATPIGMAHHPGIPVDRAHLRSDLWVADIVYLPIATELLQAARAVGARTLDGGAMATYQAVEAFERFTGVVADARAMQADFADLLAREV
ncbi:MAG: shikimate dehydrogenase [Hamadaea sp.]|nr:shikimate dehydrogenase [Hamadaea sp.]